MGTHTTLPSKVPLDGNKTLAEVLKADPTLTGEKVTTAFPDAKDGALPFLFKVLSIGTALSIQAHPDKTLAERLHRERGDVYKGEWGEDTDHTPVLEPGLGDMRRDVKRRRMWREVRREF